MSLLVHLWFNNIIMDSKSQIGFAVCDTLICIGQVTERELKAAALQYINQSTPDLVD